jgi:hypothetical protein
MAAIIDEGVTHSVRGIAPARDLSDERSAATKSRRARAVGVVRPGDDLLRGRIRRVQGRCASCHRRRPEPRSVLRAGTLPRRHLKRRR